MLSAMWAWPLTACQAAHRVIQLREGLHIIVGDGGDAPYIAYIS